MTMTATTVIKQESVSVSHTIVDTCEGKVAYVKALSSMPKQAIALEVLLVHQVTGEEITVDLLTEDPSFVSVINLIRGIRGEDGKQIYPRAWGFFESYEVA